MGRPTSELNKVFVLTIVFFIIFLLSTPVKAAQVTLLANSTDGSGDYSLMTSENAYNNGYLFDSQGTPTIMNASELTYVSGNDSYYIKLAGSNSKDSRWRNNFTLLGVQDVQWINITGIINTAASDTTHMGIMNATGFQKLAWTNVVGTNRYVTLVMNISGSNSTQYTLSGSTLTFSSSLWTNGGSSNTYTRLDMVKADVTYTPFVADTTFTVTLPIGYSNAFFNASLATENNVNASGQTVAAGFLNVTNTGNVNETFYINITTPAPTGVTLKADNNSDPAGAITVTTTLTQIISDLMTTTSQYIWLWADYDSAAQMNQQRTLTLNSSQT
jgi:hypothetical protein